MAGQLQALEQVAGRRIERGQPTFSEAHIDLLRRAIHTDIVRVLVQRHRPHHVERVGVEDAHGPIAPVGHEEPRRRGRVADALRLAESSQAPHLAARA